MDVAAMTRLAAADPATVSGLIEEHAAARLPEAGPEAWSRDLARWRGVRDALDAAAEGAEPARRLDRPPRWLQAAATGSLREWTTTWVRGGDAMDVRVLERLGLVELEHDDAYVLAFMGGVVGDPRFTTTTRAETLRADPGLREAIIWRLFEVEGGGEVSLANLDKFTAEARSWSAAFHELVEDGTLARADVLTAALGALARDFSAYRAGWFSRLYRSFDPTPDESAERQGALRHLLRSEIAATVTMALKCLVEVARAGLLDDEETTSALGPALWHEKRSTADAALTLAEGIATRRPDLAAIVADQVAVALAHPHAKVQERAARLMQKLGAGDRVAERVAELSPAVALALGLETAPPRESGPPTAATADAAGPLPADLATAPAIRAAEGPELVEIMAALLEDAADPMAVEAVLAGLARTGPTDLLAPLDTRAAGILERGPRERVSPGWLRGQLARLVRRSAGHQVPALPWTWDERREPPAERQVALRFLARRIDEVGAIVAGQAPPCLLAATPDHPAGWIRPETLASRVGAGATMTFDLVGGLLRLAPEGRRAVRDALPRGAGSGAGPRVVGLALRHALGAEPPPARLLGRRPDAAALALWTAAARARAPLASDEWAERLGLTGAGRAEPVDLRLGVPLPWDGDTSDARDEHLPWVVVDSPVRDVRDAEPTAVGDDRRGSLWSDAEDFVPWVATVYPADAEHLSYATGLDVVFRALAYTEVQHDAVRVLDALRDHEGRIGRLTRAVLAAGLSAAGVDERVHAVDAVGRQAAAGRLDAAALADGIVAVGPLTPLTRLAGSLRDLASTGPTAGGLVVDALAAALPLAPIGTRGIHALLEVLLDELIRAGRPTPSGLAPWLAQFRGTSRAASLAAGLAERR